MRERWYGDDLGRAAEDIDFMLEHFFGLTLMYKDKWGYLVYEHVINKDEEWDKVEDWKTVFQAILLIVEKYPHLEDQLLEDICVREEVVGTKWHKKYWKSK